MALNRRISDVDPELVDVEVVPWAQWISFVETPIDEFVAQRLAFEEEQNGAAFHHIRAEWHEIDLSIESLQQVTRFDAMSWVDDPWGMQEAILFETANGQWTGIIEEFSFLRGLYVPANYKADSFRNRNTNILGYMTNNAFDGGGMVREFKYRHISRYVEHRMEELVELPRPMGRRLPRTKNPFTALNFVHVSEPRQPFDKYFLRDEYLAGVDLDEGMRLTRLLDWYDDYRYSFPALERLAAGGRPSEFGIEGVVECLRTLGIDAFKKEFYTGRIALLRRGFDWQQPYNPQIDGLSARRCMLEWVDVQSWFRVGKKYQAQLKEVENADTVFSRYVDETGRCIVNVIPYRLVDWDGNRYASELTSSSVRFDGTVGLNRKQIGNFCFYAVDWPPTSGYKPVCFGVSVSEFESCGPILKNKSISPEGFECWDSVFDLGFRSVVDGVEVEMGDEFDPMVRCGQFVFRDSLLCGLRWRWIVQADILYRGILIPEDPTVDWFVEMLSLVGLGPVGVTAGGDLVLPQQRYAFESSGFVCYWDPDVISVEEFNKMYGVVEEDLIEGPYW